MRYFDLAVVGAGPAGSLAAALAARAGLSVILLEQKKLPREKPCGGMLSARTLALLPPGLELPEELIAPIRAVRVNSRGRSHLFEAPQALGGVVLRSRFDRLLAGYARRCGAELREERPLEKLALQRDGSAGDPFYRLQCGGDGGSPVYARCVVGADGAFSRCAVLAGLRRKSPPGPFAWGCAGLFPPNPGNREMETAVFYPLPFLGGLGWSFPGRGWTNRGVGGLAKPARLREAFNRLFPGVPRQGSLSTWPLPFVGPFYRPARGNLLLAGDAAGLVDPFSGEGIFQAVKSAYLAASAIQRGLVEKKPAGEIYDGLFHGHFRRGFLPSLLGALALTARSVTAPETLPRPVASIMQNRHWYGMDLPEGLV